MIGGAHMIRVMSFLILVLASSGAGAQDLPGNHVTAYGTATINVVPDQMTWRLEVRNVDANSAAGSARKHEQLVADVLSALTSFSIEESSVQTSGMRLRELWKNEHGERTLQGYEASTGVQFVLSDLASYSEVWIGLSELPSVAIAGVEIGHSDRIRFQNEARVSAVLAARDKAKAMAEALGVGIGQPVMLVEEILPAVSSGRAPSFLSNSIGQDGASTFVDEFVAPGYLNVSVRVKGVFALQY